MSGQVERNCTNMQKFEEIRTIHPRVERRLKGPCVLTIMPFMVLPFQKMTHTRPNEDCTSPEDPAISTFHEVHDPV
jgi:hypothetical protein